MKLWMMRRDYRLEPATPEALVALERIPQKTLIEVEAVQRRNAAQNSLYWSLLHRLAQWLSQDDVTPEVLHEYMKLECGIVSIVRLPDGAIKKLPGSTSFASLDQVAFAEFFEKAVRVAYEKLQVPPALVADLLTPEYADAAA